MVSRGNSLGEILKEGWIEKRSRLLQQWRKRWAVLTPQYLYTFKERQAYSSSPTESIRLATCSSVKSAEDDLRIDNTFRIDAQERTYFFRATDAGQKESWIGGIGRAMVRPTVMRSKSEEDMLNQT